MTLRRFSVFHILFHSTILIIYNIIIILMYKQTMQNMLHSLSHSFPDSQSGETAVDFPRIRPTCLTLYSTNNSLQISLITSMFEYVYLQNNNIHS